MSSIAPPTDARPPAPERRARRRRHRAAGLVAFVVAGTLAGCQVDNTPKTYDDRGGVVRQNFIESCTGRIPNQSTTVVLAPEPQCVCAFDVFKAQVPYSGDDRGRVSGYPADKPTFEELERDLPGDVNAYDKLPDNVRRALDECRRAGQAGPVVPAATAPAGSAPTTTTTTTAAETGTTATPPASS